MVTNTIPSGLKAAQGQLQNKTKLTMNRALEALRTEIVDGSGAEKSFPVVTGRYKGSLRKGNADNIWQVIQEFFKTTGTVGTKVPYAPYVEFGTSKQKAQLNFTLGIQRAKAIIEKILAQGLKL